MGNIGDEKRLNYNVNLIDSYLHGPNDVKQAKFINRKQLRNCESDERASQCITARSQ